LNEKMEAIAAAKKARPMAVAFGATMVYQLHRNEYVLPKSGRREELQSGKPRRRGPA
jgi:hypothetical protein